ncbi:MAG: glycosyltransferase family 4 protein [Bryobacterales bacterium]|nr:glycosyltransferase family 4 protein [Bryobacterales bacterium]
MTDPSKPRFVFVAPWGVTPGAGVNGVMLGMHAAMEKSYTPEFLVTGWLRPPEGQHWLPLPDVGFCLTNAIAFFVKWPWLLWRLRVLLKDAIVVNPHFAGLECLLLAILRRLGLIRKLVFSVHGSDVETALRSHPFQRRLYVFMYSSADAVTACSQALAQRLRSILPPSVPVAGIFNGADRPPLHRGERPIAAPYLLCVASYVKIKGQSTLIDAFPEVLRSHPSLRLVFIGGESTPSASERHAILSRATELGISDRVDCHVNVAHELVWGWMEHSECLILPSRREAFGIVLVEAAQVRTPVVATRVGGIPEFLDHGVHGLLCEPDDPAALAAAILETLGDRQAAQKRVEAFHQRAQDLTWDAHFEKFRRFTQL